MSRSKMEVMTTLAWEWGYRCFGSEHMMNRRVRALRMAEEAIEYCQATGVPGQQMRELVEMVWAKPPGSALQELGGTALTLAVACSGMNTSVEDVLETELKRVLAKPAHYFTQRNKAKIAAGMTGYADGRGGGSGPDIAMVFTGGPSYGSDAAATADALVNIGRLRGKLQAGFRRQMEMLDQDEKVLRGGITVKDCTVVNDPRDAGFIARQSGDVHGR